jgi:EAL domain-containing protein (putative c-di-GMP-specific phosphodiesterase class I)
MSRDESSLPAVTGADEVPVPGGPASPPNAAGGATLRGQVMELINDVLTNPDPDAQWARSQLRKQLALHPDEPERALLEHLVATRKPASPQRSLPHPGGSAIPGSPEAPFHQPVAQGARTRKRIESVLGSRMLLTAFQPVRELPDGRTTGFEALTRFVSRDGASADTWFREAEAVGLGPELEIAALQCALSAAGEIPSHLFVAFNLSPATFTDSRVHDLLQSSGLAMDKTILEFSGRASGEQWKVVVRALEPLRDRGLRIAVDGSGAGFTPADQILSLRPDIIKLDRAFIDNIIESADQDEPAVIGLAQEVGAVLAAEGIETEAELAAVIAAGMTAGQGYLLGRPSVHPLDWSAWIIQTETVPAET